ncbi:MAG TPA: nuclear transport factor 2 family protein, partial [Ideonella sp.]|nr:nuclear transport factor 2 family protein [Ideonella sp.]
MTPSPAKDPAQATRQVVDHFYDAFARSDWRGMGAAYAPDVHFSDPVFELRGDDARLMWRMLCEQAKEFRASHEIVTASADSAHVRWQAWYRFSATGRPVHNQIETQLQLA